MSMFGSVTFDGKTYYLMGEPEITGRTMPDGVNYHEVEDGENYEFEMSAKADDENFVEYIVYWIFSDIKGAGRDLDDFNYDDVHRVEAV